MNWNQTLVGRVVAKVHELGAVTVDDLLSYFPDQSREQVRKALQNAAANKHIHCKALQPRLVGSGKGMGIFAPGPNPVKKPRRIKAVPPAQPPAAPSLSNVWQLEA